jgi:subtilisin family serine protease
MSLGGKRFKKSDGIACPDDEQRAIYHALRRGVVIVAAVGNTGPAKNTIEEPAVCLGVVAVGAVDAAGAVARFSGRQPFLTLVAPGVGVPSLGRIPGQAYSGDGTSQAAAIVSGAFALLRSKYPHESGRHLVTRVLATLDAHRQKASPAYGYGLLDAYRAITAPVPADAPNPVYDAVAPFLAQNRAPRPKKLKAPAAAAPPRASTGHYEVGSSARLQTPQVVTGGVLALAGLLALVLLLVVGTRRRRARSAVDATAPPPVPLWDWADHDHGPNVVGPVPKPALGDAARPRPSPRPLPRPRPRPGPR